MTLPSEAVVEAKVVAVSIAVSAILQVLKKAPVLQPYLQGWIAVVMNVVLSIVGVLAVVQPDQVFTLNTFITVLTAALAAAGVHGTATKMLAHRREAIARKQALIANEEKQQAMLIAHQQRGYDSTGVSDAPVSGAMKEDQKFSEHED